MSDNYAKIVRNNLKTLYKQPLTELAPALPGDRSGDCFVFESFGAACEIRPDGIFLGKERQDGVIGILISLYALHARLEPIVLEPFKAFKDFPNSMPYAGAFVTHTQQILVPYVESVIGAGEMIMEQFRGQKASAGIGGDYSFVVYPLPKVALCYIFYEPDDDFPASVTCLYSNNANTFLPLDGLADVGEYTSRKILNLITNNSSFTS